MDLYINSVGVISGAGNNMSGSFLQAQPAYNATTIPAAEPDYKEYIPVMQLRRMSKAVRMGVVAAKTAMQHAGAEKPDAISVGTAYGCLQDTETFLGKMIEQDEQMLTPTAFIQSTHNTVSGQIALLAGCNGHNLTFVQRGHSFEQALINTMLYLDEHPGELMLVGGIDELTPTGTQVLQRSGLYTKQELSYNDMLTCDNDAAIGGEGAVFFSVTQQPLSGRYLKIEALEIFKADEAVAFQKIKAFANNNGSCDVFISGMNGERRNRAFYQKVKDEIFNAVPHAMFKHLCGEYPVSASFAISMLFHGLPGFAYTGNIPSGVSSAILVNNHCDYYTCWKIQVAG